MRTLIPCVFVCVSCSPASNAFRLARSPEAAAEGSARPALDDGADADPTRVGAPALGAARAVGPCAAPSQPCGQPAALPSEVFDLRPWKLQLPVGAPEQPDEIEQPELAEYAADPWFTVDTRTGRRVVFRANVDGVTTSGSSYPRSELREMTADGAERAAWSTEQGVHTMTIRQAITHVPEVKPHVVAGQIHDAEDDVVMIRLEGRKLFVEGGGENLGTLDEDYRLGTIFTARFQAHDGRIDVYYEDLATPAVTVPIEADGCYFKAGVYTQSNPDRGDAPGAYGEVRVAELTVTHAE